MARKTGMGRQNGNMGNSDNAFDVDLLDIFRYLRHMSQLYMTEGNRMKAIRIGADMIRKKALDLLQSDESGRKVYDSNKGAIRLRANKDKSYIKVSGTGKDDWRMPWLANGTGARDTTGNGPVIKVKAHRGMMQKPKGKYIPKAVASEGTAVIDTIKKWYEDYIAKWKEANPGKKI